MPNPTLAINSVEIRIAMYCLKRSVFNHYNAGTSHEFDANTKPGAWVTRLPGETDLTEITDPSVFPQAASPLPVGEGRTPTDITAFAFKNIDYENAIRHLLDGITTATIADGGGTNAYWSEATVTGVGAIVVPKGYDLPRPTKLIIWHRITYSVDGATAHVTVSGYKEVCLAGLSDYPINSTITFACAIRDQGGMYTDHDALIPVADPMTNPQIATVRGFAAFRGLNRDDILPYFNINSEPYIKVGVRYYSGGEFATYIPPLAAYQQLSLMPTLSTALTLGGTVVFSLANADSINSKAKYYPHTFYWASLTLQDPSNTQYITLPRTLLTGLGDNKLVDSYIPVICLRDLTVINSEGQYTWTDHNLAGLPLTNEIHTAFADPSITQRKKTALLYGGLGNTATKNIPIQISNPAGQPTLTFPANQCKVEIPALASVKIFNTFTNQWETFTGTNATPIDLSAGITRPQFTVDADRVLMKDIPFKLTNATAALLGITIPQSMLLNQVRLPINTHIYYTQSGSNYSVDMPGYLYLLTPCTSANLVDLSVSVNPNNPTQATGWRFTIKRKIYAQTDFGDTDFEPNNSGYYRRVLSVLSPQTSTLTQTTHTFIPSGGSSEFGEWLLEMYDLTPGQTFTVPAGSNNITLVVPDDLFTAVAANILMQYYNYLAGATGQVDISYPFNMDDSVSSTARITIPAP